MATAAALPDARDFAPVGTGPWKVVEHDPLTHTLFAPAAGAGDMTLYYGAVDGDEHGISSLGDDTVLGQILLIED